MGARGFHQRSEKFDHALGLVVPIILLQNPCANRCASTFEYSPVQGGDFTQFLAQCLLEIVCLEVKPFIAKHLVHTSGARRKDSSARHPKLKNLGRETILQAPDRKWW